MKNIKHQKDTNSYMQLCLYQEDKGNIYLMVPTFWNEINKTWIGFVKLKNGKIIHAEGKHSQELENNFNLKLHESFQKYPEETLSMFMPLEYWESRL